MSEAKNLKSEGGARTTRGEVLRLRVSNGKPASSGAESVPPASRNRAGPPAVTRTTRNRVSTSQVPEQTAGSAMLQELRATGAIGIWKDREDIKDSSEFARELRRRAQARADRKTRAG